MAALGISYIFWLVGWLVASIGGWLTGDGNDGQMTALAGSTAFCQGEAGGTMTAKVGRTMMAKTGG